MNSNTLAAVFLICVTSLIALGIIGVTLTNIFG